MVKKDLERLKFTISKGNKPNKNDIDALNGIIEYVNNERDRELNNYQLFAKLFLNVFKNDIIKSKGNYQLALKNATDVLKIDLYSHLEAFTREINQIWLEKAVNNNEINNNFNYPKWDIEETKNRLNDIVLNLIEDFK